MFITANISKEETLLLQEAGLSSTSIGQGMTMLRKAWWQNEWNFYQAFFLLSIGIERLLKIIVILRFKSDNNSFPSDNLLKKLGHDIKKLIVTVESYNINEEVTTCEVEIAIIDFLTAFAKSNRYYNLDAISGMQVANNPLSEWKIIQNKIKQKEGLVSQTFDKEFLEQMAGPFGSPKAVEEYLKDADILDEIQGHSVYYIWRIIQKLADKLIRIEYENRTAISLREFFPYFIKGWDKNKEYDILEWKDWNYLK
jgi:hypothetical protein